jgi:LacI family transcriptional regulator
LTGRSTLKEVAKALDVSVATVSRALAGYSDISVKTRERVAEKARELGYVPNSAGRMLVSGRSGFIGLVVQARGPDFVDAFLGQFVVGLGEGLIAQGSDLFLAVATQGQSELEVIKHVVNSGRCDGLVLNRIAENDERVNFLLGKRFPFVTHGRSLGTTAPYSWIDTDGEAAIRQAFEVLHDLGHRHFGFVSISEPMSFAKLREQGLRTAISDRGDLDVTLEVIRSPRGDRVARRESIRMMLSGPRRPTAIIGLFDEIALSVMQEAARMEISVPTDLSVIGFDNVVAAEFSSPALSTFDQDTRGSAHELAAMIHTVLAGKQGEPTTILKQPKFLPRGSHGAVPRQ